MPACQSTTYKRSSCSIARNNCSASFARARRQRHHQRLQPRAIEEQLRRRAPGRVGRRLGNRPVTFPDVRHVDDGEVHVTRFDTSLANVLDDGLATRAGAKGAFRDPLVPALPGLNASSCVAVASSSVLKGESTDVCLQGERFRLRGGAAESDGSRAGKRGAGLGRLMALSELLHFGVC